MYSLQFKYENFKLSSIYLIKKSETGIYQLLVQNHCITYKTRLSLRGRRLKEKGMGVLGAREKPLAFLSRLKLPFPSLSNACQAG